MRLVAEALNRLRPADIAIFYEFRRPPYGGANQFMLALRGELERRGLHTASNRLPKSARACLFNSFNFDFDRLRKLRRAGCRMVHRVDGPISIYRGRDDGTDHRIWKLNNELADVTVFQSYYSLEAHRALGMEFRSPVVIMNTVDPGVFYPAETANPLIGRKVRLISTSWSDNPRKGAATYKWLEENLDWDQYEYTFVGRSSVRFERIRVVPPVSSRRLAQLLREHDIYIMAALHEACSNALLEALACSLPAVYVLSGSNAEVVGGGGLGFADKEEIPALLEQLAEEHFARRASIAVPTLNRVADQYLAVMGLASTT